MLLISLLSFACLIVHLAIQRNPSHPGVVHGAIWLLIGLGYAGFQAEMEVVSSKTMGVLITGILVFSIGVHLGGKSINLDYALPRAGRQFSCLPPAIVLISALGFVMLCVKAFEYAPFNSDGSWRAWYVSLRGATVGHKGSFGSAGYVLNFCFAGVVYLILFSRRVRHTPWLWLCIVLSLGFALFSTGRTYLLLLVCMILGAAMPKSWQTRVSILLLAPMLIVAVTWMSGRFDVTSGSGFAQHAKAYSIAAVSSLDYLVNSNLPQTWGSMTFRTPLAVLEAVGVPLTVPDLIQPNPLTRISSTNVYTVFSPYYRDFGLVGVAFFMLLLGALHGWVFRQLKTGMPIIIVANALLFYALLMQFFQDQYFSLMSQWIQILFWTYLLNKLQPLPVVSEWPRKSGSV
jgi:oligosaccharide repeat unit polymerase